MTDLLTALQSAERGSRALDWSIAHEFGESHSPAACPDYSTSIDAALALVERVLPGTNALMAITAERTIVTLREKPLGEHGAWGDSVAAPTPPLALVIALVRAKGASDA